MDRWKEAKGRIVEDLQGVCGRTLTVLALGTMIRKKLPTICGLSGSVDTLLEPRRDSTGEREEALTRQAERTAILDSILENMYQEIKKPIKEKGELERQRWLCDLSVM